MDAVADTCCVALPWSRLLWRLLTCQSFPCSLAAPSIATVSAALSLGLGLGQTPNTGLRHPSFGGRCRKAVPRSVGLGQTPNAGVRHPSFGGRCQKAVLGVWVWGKLQALVYDHLWFTTSFLQGEMCQKAMSGV